MTSAMKKRQRRKTRSYRAASLKGARAKRRMKLTQEQREIYEQLAEGFLEQLKPETIISNVRIRTIDLVPKVKWP